jgi:predicted amidohydrolase YtcJ
MFGRTSCQFWLAVVAILWITIGSGWAAAQSGGPYELTWSTVDGGGYTFSQGGSYALGGTVGQPDAGSMAGGGYTLSGGFWPGGAGPMKYWIYLPLVLRNFNPLQADLIFHNGQILTMEGADWSAQAIAIRDQRILAVGSDAEISALQGPGTQVIDLDGRALLPGFVDAHSHLFNETGCMGLGLAGAQQVALENGITTLGILYTSPEFLSEMQVFAAEGGLEVRTSLYLSFDTACGELLGDWYLAHPPKQEFGEMLRIGGVKVFADGGSCGAPAFSYDHPVFGYGDLWFTQGEMNDIVSSLQAAGYQAAIHALGDRAVEQALAAIEAALDGTPNTPRHRIEHNAVVHDDLLARYAQVDPVALIFGAYPACQSFADPPPEAYQDWEWRWPDLFSANPGGHFAWHSDRGAALFPLPPLMHLYSMVTPFEVDQDGETICDTPEWLAHKMLTVEQALPMMNIEAAYSLFRETEVGSLEPGKLADLVILSNNPLAVDPLAIKDIEVLMTMVGGQVAYCALGSESQCPGP